MTEMNGETDIDFTDDEIRDELSKLGYGNVPHHRFEEFKSDLRSLISHERSKISSQNTSLSSHVDTTGSIAGIPSRRRYPLEENQGSHHGPGFLEYRGTSHYGKENRYVDNSVPSYKKSYTVDPPRGNFSMYDTTPDTSQLQIRDDVSETDSERRMVKRKVLRKRKDGSKVIDESVTESEAGSLSDIHDRLKELGIRDDERRCASARSEPPYRLAPDDPRPASVILRAPDHTKPVRKSDPVARYQQFRRSWSQQRAPGEKTHKNLRWNVREQMLSQDQVIEKRPQRVFVPNKYVVPTDKQRKSLRWNVRMELAHGQMPPHGFYHEC